MKLDLLVGVRPIVVVVDLWLLALVALVRPMLRDHGDDQGDGMTLVLLPPPQLPRFRRTFAFVLAFVALVVLYHSITGPYSPDNLYREALRHLVDRVVSAPAQVDAYLADFVLGVRVLMFASMLSLALTCRAEPLRRLSIVIQSVWYLAVVFLFDCLLVVLSVLTGMGIGPGTVFGNWFAIGVGFLGTARIIYANFALPKPTALRTTIRTGWRDTGILVATTTIGMTVSLVVLLLAYREISAELRPVVALFAPIPFSLLTYLVRSGLLALIGLILLARPAIDGERPPIDVIIPAYNEELVIVETLRSIDAAAERYGGRVHIFLTDDGSTDQTRPLAECTMAAFVAATGEVIEGEHRGKSAALNLALAETDSDIVIRIDADTLIADDALIHLPRWFRDPAIGIVEALMWPRGENTPYHRMRLFEELRIFGLNHRVLQTVDAVNVVPGVFTAFRRAPAMELGGFTVGMNGEDGDFTMRMGRLGWRSRLDPKIRVYEGVPETFLEMREQRVRWSRATIHNQARHGIYRVGVAPPMVWFTQTYQYFRRIRSPIFFVVPIYLVISAVFEVAWRLPIVAALVGLAVAQMIFVTLTVLLAARYGFTRRIGWVVLWPLWRYCLTMFSTESVLSLPGRPLTIRARDHRVIAEAVVH